MSKKTALLSTTLFLLILSYLIVSLSKSGYDDYAQSIAVKAVIWTMYTFLESKFKLHLSNYVRFLVMTVIISDSLFGLYYNLYVTSSVFDKFQHLIGGYAFSLLAYYSLIGRSNMVLLSRRFNFLIVLALGISIGALYEIAEFIGDHLTQPRVPSQPSLLDTDLDLIADTIGALLAAVHITLSPKR